MARSFIEEFVFVVTFLPYIYIYILLIGWIRLPLSLSVFLSLYLCTYTLLQLSRCYSMAVSTASIVSSPSQSLFTVRSYSLCSSGPTALNLSGMSLLVFASLFHIFFSYNFALESEFLDYFVNHSVVTIS